MTLFIILACSSLSASEFKFKEGPVTIDADSIAYNGDEDSYHARGGVLITFSGGFLKADSVIFYRADDVANASGNVFLKNENDILQGDSLTFNIVSRTGTLQSGEIFMSENHTFIRGEHIEKKSADNYLLKEGSFTTCDGACPDWRISGRQVDITVDGYGVLNRGQFLVRDIPVLYLPWLIFPVKTSRQTGFLFPRFSYSLDNNGFDIEIPFFWAFSESADATFYQRYMEKRGFKEGVELRYFLNENSSGIFYADLIRDRKSISETVGTMNRDWHDDRNRWSYYLNHETALAGGVNIRADINRVSDHWYFRDFTSFNYYSDNYAPSGREKFQRVSMPGDESTAYLNSIVRMTRDWPLYNLTMLARYTDDFSSRDNNLTFQKYPEVNLTGFRRPLFDSPVQMEFSGGYDYFFSQEGQKGHLWELSPTFYLPTSLGRYLKMTSWAGLRADTWERTDSLMATGEKNGHRVLFSMGTALSSEFARTFDVGGDHINKLRHVIKPEISYTYAPGVDSGDIPEFLDQFTDYHSLRYGFVSTVTAKTKPETGKAGYWEMMRLKVSQAYDIRESRREDNGTAGGRRPFGDVDMELDMAPSRYLTVSARNKFDVNSGVMVQNNYDVTLSDNRGDSVSAGYRYNRDILEEINLSMRGKLTDSLGLSYILRKNQFDRTTIESSVGIRYRKQCWAVELIVSDRYNDRNVMVYFSLLGLGGK
jgi:LPS-assembly protein